MAFRLFAAQAVHVNGFKLFKRKGTAGKNSHNYMCMKHTLSAIIAVSNFFHVLVVRRKQYNSDSTCMSYNRLVRSTGCYLPLAPLSAGISSSALQPSWISSHGWMVGWILNIIKLKKDDDKAPGFFKQYNEML